MERRDWSLEAYKELIYVDSLDDELKADMLVKWNNKYLSENKIEDFDLELEELKKMSELFYRNINFLKDYKEKTRVEISELNKMKKFLHH